MRLSIRPQAAVNLTFRLMFTTDFLKSQNLLEKHTDKKSKYSSISKLKS